MPSIEPLRAVGAWIIEGGEPARLLASCSGSSPRTEFLSAEKNVLDTITKAGVVIGSPQ